MLSRSMEFGKVRRKTPRRMSRASLLRDAIVIVGITACLFALVEFSVRLLAPQRLTTTVIKGESLGLRDSILGHVNRPNSHVAVKGPEFEVEYQVNDQGFRDVSTYAATARDGVTRILVLGDSFAFGASNHYEDIWPVAMERTLRAAGHQVEIIKAGVPAYDTRLEVLYLERLANLYHPDIVLLTFLPNDLFTNEPIRDADAPLQADELANRGVETVTSKKSNLHSLTLARRVMMLSDRLYANLYLMTPRAAFFTVPPTEQLGRQIEVTRSLLSRGQQFCRDNGCELVVPSIPQLFQVFATDVNGVDPAYIDNEFLESAKEWGITWVPLLPALTEAYDRSGADLYHRYDGHLNAEGNQVVGAVMAKFLDTRLTQQTSSAANRK